MSNTVDSTYYRACLWGPALRVYRVYRVSLLWQGLVGAFATITIAMHMIYE